MLSKIKNYFNKGTERTVIIKKNIFQSFGFKAVSILLSLLIVPMTINYISPEQYGIWLTVSSIVAWISYFDLGLGHGLRNRYAESKARVDNSLSSKYISTTYAVIGLIFLLVFVVFVVVNQFINWNSFLNIYQVKNLLLQKLMFFLVGFFCLTMFFKVINSLLLGDQKTAFASGISVSEQLVSLIVIYILSKVASSNLIYLAFVTAGVPCLVLFLISIYCFSPNGYFASYRPSLSNIDLKLTRSLFGLGSKFFIIQLSLLAIFQIVNIIISRNCGQLAVSQYQLSYKYFNMLYMVSIIILTPFWSAFTDAYTKKDYVWMKDTFNKLNKISIASIPILVCMVIIAPLFFKLWINDSIDIPIALHLCMACYTLSMIFAGVHMYILNGIGKVIVQLLVYVFFAFFSIPVMNLLSKQVGIYGILLFLSIVYISQAILGRIQLVKLLNKKAKGIWNK